MRRQLLGIIAACTLAGTLVASAPAGLAAASSGGPIEFGALYTLSGPEAAFGQVNLKTTQALVTYLNSHGGISGRKVKLVYYNTAGTPSTAVTDAQKLVADGVVGIVYAGTSVTDHQSTVVFDKDKIPAVDDNPTDTWATGNKWPYAFTDYNILKPQGVAIDGYAKHLGASKVGILTDPTPLGEQLAGDVKAAAKREGVTIVGSQSYALTATDMTTQLQALKSAGAEAVALPGETGLGQVYTSLQGMGWSPYLFTEFAGYFVGYTSLGSLAQKTFSTCQIHIPQGTAIPKQLTQITSYVTRKTGVTQIGLASALLNENDSLLIFKYAIQQAKSTTGTKIRDQIEKIRNRGFTVPQWKYTFTSLNHAGWPDSSSYICLMKPLGKYQTPYTAPGSNGT